MLENEFAQGSISKSQGDKGADIIEDLEDILTMSPEDAKDFDKNQMTNMKQKIAKSIEGIITLLNSSEQTGKEKVGMLLQELDMMKRETLGVSKSTAATRQRHLDEIHTADEKRKTKAKAKTVSDALKEDKDLEKELTSIEKANNAKWVANDKQKKAEGKAIVDQKKAEGKAIVDEKKAESKEKKAEAKEMKELSKGLDTLFTKFKAAVVHKPKPETSQTPPKQQTPPKPKSQSPPQSQRKSSRIQEQNTQPKK
jgi:membrane protein involved in colicin uptake